MAKKMNVSNMYYAARVALGCARDAETPLEALTWIERAMHWRDCARTARAKKAG